MDYGLKGKTAFISGGSHGIGLAIARSLSAEGCNLILSARDENKLKNAKHELESCGVLCDIIGGDVIQESDVSNIINFVLSLGGIDILINNVGGGGRWGTDDILNTPISVWRDVLEKNLWAAIKFTIAFLPIMVQKQWGRVISITSIYGIEAGSRPWFNIAKSSEMVLMKNLSIKKEFVRKGITFNSVAPGDIMIPDTGWDETQKKLDSLLDQYPMGKIGTPEDVSSIVVFLCSNMASYINGASISVDGGQSHAF